MPLTKEPKNPEPLSTMRPFKFATKVTEAVKNSTEATINCLLHKNAWKWHSWLKEHHRQQSHTTTKIDHMPIINATAHESKILLTLIKRSQQLSRKSGMNYNVITLHKMVYAKSQQLIWSNSSDYENVIIRLGGFLFAYNCLNVNGMRFSNSGLADIWGESDVFEPETANKALEWKYYNRSVRGVKVTIETLW